MSLVRFSSHWFGVSPALRLLVGAMLMLAPLTPGYWWVSLAERSEEEHGVADEAPGVIFTQGRQLQPPPPRRTSPFSMTRRTRVPAALDVSDVMDTGVTASRPRPIRRLHYAPNEPDRQA